MDGKRKRIETDAFSNENSVGVKYESKIFFEHGLTNAKHDLEYISDSTHFLSNSI